MNLLRFMHETPILKYILWVVIISFVLAIFVIWGGGMDRESKSGLFQEDYAVKVDGETLPPGYLRLSYQYYGERIRQMFGDQFRESYLKGSAGRLASEMVDTLVVEQLAKESGLSVSDREMAESIVRIFGFKDPKNEYPEMLARRGVTAQEFERYFRSQLLLQKYFDLLRDAQHFGDDELLKRYRDQNDKFKATVAFARTADFRVKLTAPADAELHAAFEQKKSTLTVPERRSVRYLWVNLSDIRAGLAVPDADVLAYYDLHKDQFGGKPFAQVKEQVRQTVLFTDPKARERADGAFEGAKTALESAADDAALTALAAKYGLKVQSTAKPFSQEEPAGPLGLDASFNKAIFVAEKGKWSAPVPLRGGIARVQVTDITASHPATFEDVKEKLRNTLMDERADAQARAAAQSLARSIRDAKSLEETAKKDGLATQVSGELSSRETLPLAGVADPAAGKALAAASAGAVVGPLKAGPGYLVAVIMEHKPADPEKFRAEKADFARQQASEVSNRIVDEAIARRRKELEDKKAVFINAAVVKQLDPSSSGPERE